MLRAVTYCRCSTEEESQQDALKQQAVESRESVLRQGWLLVDEYIEAKSGTTTVNRSEYNRLYEELSSDKFDVVVIKSQDRLMRNTKDWYLFIDRLVSNEKKLFMYLEGKFYSADDALITGIKAILAEEYSKELSRKINNAHYHRQQDGRSFILPPRTYGLRKNAGGIIELVQEEAEAARIMFHLCKSMGCISIAHYLEENGIYDRDGRTFSGETIRRIIRNPIRCGTVVQNKIHFDFQTKRTIRLPKDQWVIHKNAVPAVVSEQEWKEANDAMDMRKERYCQKKGCTDQEHLTQKEAVKKDAKEETYVRSRCGQYQLSGKIRCGECSSPYYRRYRKRYGDQKLIVEWKCKRYIQNGRKQKAGDNPNKNSKKVDGHVQGCDNIHLDEEKLLSLLWDVSGQYFHRKETDDTRETDDTVIIDRMMSFLTEVLGQEHLDSQLKKLEKEKERLRQQEKKLLDKLLEEVISDEDYKERRAKIQQKSGKIDQQIRKLNGSNESQPVLEQRLDEIRKYLEDGAVRRAGLAAMIEEIQEIVVYPGKLVIRYKSQILEVPLDQEISYAARKEAQNQRIMGYMNQNPRITAKMIAEKEGISLSAANAGIRRLKRQGKVHFEGKGGHGEWVVFVGNKGL